MNRKTILFTLVALLCFSSSTLWAQWEPTNFTQSTWVLLQAENGNLIATDDIYPDMGGVYLSQDEGFSWEKTNALDFAYTSGFIHNESVYLGGTDCNVAISHDNGKTWSNVNFSGLFPVVSQNDPIYGMEYHNNRIYASVLNFGVVFSDDEGFTWNLTDRNSLLDEDNPVDGGQWSYDLKSYNGKLYNIGAFGIWEYDEIEDLWSKIDDRWYGGSALVVDNVFYVIYNAYGISDGIRYTTDFEEWGVMPIPENTTTSIRFMEYYEGAFFIGHLNEAILYTLDYGENWMEYRENFPTDSPAPGVDFYGAPMNLVFSDDIMFCGVFSSIEGVGGIFSAPVPAVVLDVKDLPALVQPVAYPNPAKDFLYIEYSNKQIIKGSLMVTDVLGKVKYSKTIRNEENNTITIPIANWVPGIYLYVIENGKSKTSGKFIVE